MTRKKAGKVKANNSIYCSSHYLELLGEVVPKMGVGGCYSVPDISNSPVQLREMYLNAKSSVTVDSD